MKQWQVLRTVFPEYAVWWRVRYKHVGVGWYAGNVALLAVGNAVVHEHRHTIEFHAVDFRARIAQVVDICVKSADIGAIQAIVVVAADEYFVAVGKVAEPVEEVDGLGLGSHHAEVARMHRHVGLGQVA